MFNKKSAFIIKVFQTIVFIFIVISTTFRPICPPAFFRCLSNSGTFTELRSTSFIETTGVACSDSVCHDRVQVLSIPVYEEGQRTYQPKRCGNNNKDEDNSPKNLDDKNQQASSQKFRQLKNQLLGCLKCSSRHNKAFSQEKSNWDENVPIPEDEKDLLFRNLVCKREYFRPLFFYTEFGKTTGTLEMLKQGYDIKPIQVILVWFGFFV